ncbi:MAG: hypothetical protein ACLSGS_09180 [Adlercreutzia sp.]
MAVAVGPPPVLFPGLHGLRGPAPSTLAFVDGHPVVDGDVCNGCGQCGSSARRSVRTFAGTRRYRGGASRGSWPLGRTVVEDGSEMGV